MQITNTHYSQLKDYLNQLIEVSGRDDVTKITQVVIGVLLSVDNSGVCRFLAGKTAKPVKMMTNFRDRYSVEFLRWPSNLSTIGRIITLADCRYFLTRNLPTTQILIQAVNVQKVAGPTVIQVSTTNQATNSSVYKPPANRLEIVEASLEPIPAPLQINATRRWVRPNLPRASVVISYRGHKGDKDAQGMIFDHQAIQQSINYPTCLLLPRTQDIRDRVKAIFRTELNELTWQFAHGVMDNLRRRPAFKINFSELGLLIIPGRVRKIEDEPNRTEHEYQKIREAFRRGQPMLAICAGAWRLFEELVVLTQFPDRIADTMYGKADFHRNNRTLVQVTGHNYRAGMLRLNEGGQVRYNVQIHNVLVQQNTQLEKIWNNELIPESVNSVHWKAINLNSNIQPRNIRINTLSACIPEKVSQENTVEGYENEFGAPTMGIQWHPEGYPANSKHSHIIKYMAQAGDAYAAKRRMLAQFNQMHQ